MTKQKAPLALILAASMLVMLMGGGMAFYMMLSPAPAPSVPMPAEPAVVEPAPAPPPPTLAPPVSEPIVIAPSEDDADSPDAAPVNLNSSVRSAADSPEPEPEPLLTNDPRDKRTIQRVVQRSVAPVRACYDEGRERDPSLAGRLTVRLVIAEDGAVRETEITESELGDDAVSTCVQGVVASMVFPQSDGGEVTVSYPFVFTPG